MTRETIETLPERLAELREARGLSQEQLAEKAGTSRFSVSRLERGLRAPSLFLAVQLADALAVPLDALREPKGTPIPTQKKSRK